MTMTPCAVRGNSPRRCSQSIVSIPANLDGPTLGILKLEVKFPPRTSDECKPWYNVWLSWSIHVCAHTCAELRAQFLLESIADLRSSLKEQGSDLYIRVGKPEEVLAAVVKATGAHTVRATTRFTDTYIPANMCSCDIEHHRLCLLLGFCAEGNLQRRAASGSWCAKGSSED